MTEAQNWPLRISDNSDQQPYSQKLFSRSICILPISMSTMVLVDMYNPKQEIDE